MPCCFLTSTGSPFTFATAANFGIRARHRLRENGRIGVVKRRHRMGTHRMHLLEFEWLLERELRDSVMKHYPLDWKEDAVTHDLMIRIRNYFKDVTLESAGYPVHIEWEIYRFHGARESTYGDVGVLLKCRTAHGVRSRGCRVS